MNDVVEFILICLGVLAVTGCGAGLYFLVERFLLWLRWESKHWHYMMTRRRWEE